MNFNNQLNKIVLKKHNKRLLDESESAFDAAFDMHCFITECSETCDIIKKVGTYED